MMDKRKRSVLNRSEDKNLLDQFSPLKVGRIIPTSKQPRVNVFESYRPRKEQCLDYKISQTFTNFQKGDLKINVEETHATYEPLPPEVCKKITKKVKRFHGGPPQWEFIDEIWLKQQAISQKQAVKVLREATTEKIRSRKKIKLEKHEIVQRLIGPEWFMELSPNQLHAVDQLLMAINKDLNDRTVVNTQEIMAILGLVLRPNQRHLEIALKHSCRCAVEFLLVLYQILEPDRENYSLNDRIILSAVVHLAITDTLKELHIRIPSPPKETQCEVKSVVKKEKKIRYKSPYLQPQTFYPAPPRFTGIYENKHIQFPESPYFAYLPYMDLERKHFRKIIRDLRTHCSPEEKETWKEYDAVQNFYCILPGAIDTPVLLPASRLKICWNMLNKKTKHQPPIIHLVKVVDDEEECCNCLEIREKNRADSLAKRSLCDKGATKFIQANLPCDECLEKQLRRRSVKIIGGYVRMTCPCDHVPIIQGTCLTKPCECFIQYKNRVVISRARQMLSDAGTKHVISGVVMSKYGPVYNFAATLGDPDCKCHEIQQIKQWKRMEKSKIMKNSTKYAIGGVHMTKEGPVYILTNVVARKSCSCIEKYRNSLIVAETQHEMKRNSTKFVINGVVNTKEFGPVYCQSGAFINDMETDKILKDFCGCLIKKPKCLSTCEERAEYGDVLIKQDLETDSITCKPEYPQIGDGDHNIPEKDDHNDFSNIRDTKHSETTTSRSDDYSSSSDSECSCTISSQVSESSDGCESTQQQRKRLCEICQQREDNRDKYCGGVISSDPSSASTVSDPAKCKCKQALNKLMTEKCECEDCNVRIRREYATHIYGGTKSTPSGNTFPVVQGIYQPQCSCLHDHLAKMKQVEDYKARAVLRYKTMRHVNKYCISGVTMTKEGPVYNISGLSPPVECDCAVRIREKEAEQERLKRMPKMPCGRVKYNVVGVKQMPNDTENVYILSQALDIPECKCMKLLRKFEETHTNCVEEFDKFLKMIKEEENRVPDDMDYSDKEELERRSTNLNYIEEGQEMNPNVEENEVKPVQDIQIKNEDDVSSNRSHEKTSENPSESSSSDGKHCSCKSRKNKVASKGENNSLSESSSSEYDSESSESDYDSESSESSEDGEFGACTILKPDEVKPIILREREIPEYFMSKRYVIFKKIPKNSKEQEIILKHILEGMAEDGYPLAKLPEVHKLPIFKLWWEMRSGIYWTQADRRKYVGHSVDFWKHTDFCYKEPEIDQLPFTKKDLRHLTWGKAEMVKSVTSQYTYNYYRKLKQVTIATGREFFAPTYSYQFPTATWRDCAFAYIPTKEEAVFPYKIYQPHDSRYIPENKKFHCYC